MCVYVCACEYEEENGSTNQHQGFASKKVREHSKQRVHDFEKQLASFSKIFVYLQMGFVALITRLTLEC